MREVTTIIDTNDAGSFYDRIARFYEWTFKFNRYSISIENYLDELKLPLPANARILDAGCGTGLLTTTLLRALRRPAHIVAVDLSAASLVAAEKAVERSERQAKHRVQFAQGNLLTLPFANDSFDFIVTCGALEYVPLDQGMDELARVLTPGGYLLHVPIRPTFISRMWEVLFRFKLHPPARIEQETSRHFRILDRHCFPPLDPIGWTKVAILAQKP